MVTDKVEKAKLSEISEVKVYIHEQINAFRIEVNSKIDVLQQEMSKYFRWTVGIIITLFLATLAL